MVGPRSAEALDSGCKTDVFLAQVYKFTSYHTELNDETMKFMKDNLERWAPNHKPLWTCIGVAKLALEGMRVEIEVVAHKG